MLKILRKSGVDHFLIVLTIFLVLFSWKKFVFLCTPVEAERMLEYYHFAKMVILQYHSFPNFSYGYHPFRYHTDGILKTYEFFSFPETPFLTPFILFYLFSDILTAEKISLFFHLIVGVLGIFALGRYFKINRMGIILWTILYSLSVNSLSRYAFGDINWKTICFFPLVFYFYIRSYENKKFILVSALINLLIFFEGGIHIFIFTNLFVGVFCIFYYFESKKIKIFLNLLTFFIFELLLGSIRLIPVISFFGGYDPAPVSSELRFGVLPPYSLKDLFTALTTPFWGSEYSNYTGILVIVLFFITILFGFKLNRPILLTSLFFLLLTVKFDGISLFYLLREFPVFNTQRVPPRFFVMALFGFGLLSGLLITRIQQKLEKTGKKALVLFEIFMLIFISYIYLDLNRVFNLFQKGCNPLVFSEEPVYFNYIPDLAPSGKCVQKFSNPNLRIWKLSLKEDVCAIFEGLDWRLYRNVLKFKIYRNERFEEINSQPYNGYVSLKIPKDATILKMKYDSPYFKIGFAITLISLLLGFLYFLSPRFFKKGIWLFH